MRKFEIWTDTFEFRFDGDVPPMSEDRIFEEYLYLSNNDPDLVAKFDNLEDAEAAWLESYANYGSTHVRNGRHNHVIWGTLAYLEEVDVYGDDEDFRETEGIRETSVEPYEPEEEEE